MRAKYGSRFRTSLLLCAIALAGPAWTPAARAQESERLVVPDGFAVEIYAEGLAGPRGMAFGPDGHLYVALVAEGRVVQLADSSGDGRAEVATTVIEDLDRPIAITWNDDELWVVEMTRIIRIHASEPDSASELTVVVDSLPADGPTSRALLFEPPGQAFYLALAASCDLCREDDIRRATILRFSADGESQEIWAQGLRATAGLALHPGTGELWATDVGRSGLGDRLPPDELNVIRRGRHYGWPYCYGNRLANPEFADSRRCDVTEPPVLAFQAHSGPQGIVFYSGDMFPAEYRGDAFVALGGSGADRSMTAGYKVVRVRVEAGRPLGVEDFVSGWLTPGGRAWGRPAVPLVGPDGALYVSDEAGGRIWRITHRLEGEHSNVGER